VVELRGELVALRDDSGELLAGVAGACFQADHRALNALDDLDGAARVVGRDPALLADLGERPVQAAASAS